MPAAEYQFKLNGTWYPLVTPLFAQSPLAFLGEVLWNCVETDKERRQIRQALAYYVPDEVGDQLAKNIVDIKAADRWFTVLVCSQVSTLSFLKKCPHSN